MAFNPKDHTNKQTNGVACCLLVAPRVMMEDLLADQQQTKQRRRQCKTPFATKSNIQNQI
jgi:hypothetical protein